MFICKRGFKGIIGIFEGVFEKKSEVTPRLIFRNKFVYIECVWDRLCVCVLDRLCVCVCVFDRLYVCVLDRMFVSLCWTECVCLCV